jgi:hypothetical protein
MLEFKNEKSGKISMISTISMPTPETPEALLPDIHEDSSPATPEARRAVRPRPRIQLFPFFWL